MPVQIQEMIIRVSVSDNDAKSDPAPQSKETEREDIIRECVDIILDILKTKLER
jgi:hypothetical protein